MVEKTGLGAEYVIERPVARPRHRCEEITSDHKKIKWETVEWILLVVNPNDAPL